MSWDQVPRHGPRGHAADYLGAQSEAAADPPAARVAAPAREGGAVRRRGRGSRPGRGRRGSRAGRGAARRRGRRAGAPGEGVDDGAPAARDGPLPARVAAAWRRPALTLPLARRRPGEPGHDLAGRGRLRSIGRTVTWLRRPDGPESAPGLGRCDLPRAAGRVSTSRPGSAWRSSRTAAPPLARLDPGVPVTYVLGAEREGLPEDVVAACDETATIPLAEGSESLNVAVAGAIALYEHRRRSVESSHGQNRRCLDLTRPQERPLGRARASACDRRPGARGLRAREPAEARGALRLEGAPRLGRRRAGRDPREPDRRGRRRGAVADRPACPRRRGRLRDHDGLRSVPPHGRAAPGTARRARGQARDAGASRRGRRGRGRRRDRAALEPRLATKIMSSPPRCGERSNQP